MAKKKPKPVDPKWAASFAALQAKLGLDDAGMGRQFGVKARTYLSWKYGERNPSPTASILLEMLAKK